MQHAKQINAFLVSLPIYTVILSLVAVFGFSIPLQELSIFVLFIFSVILGLVQPIGQLLLSDK